MMKSELFWNKSIQNESRHTESADVTSFLNEATYYSPPILFQELLPC